MKFRKKPVEIEAFQVPYAVSDKSELRAWLSTYAGSRKWTIHDAGTVAIETLEGTMTADLGDWIICGVQGEIYPCKPDIFAETYETAP